MLVLSVSFSGIEVMELEGDVPRMVVVDDERSIRGGRGGAFGVDAVVEGGIEGLRLGEGKGVISVDGETSTNSASRYHFLRRV